MRSLRDPIFRIIRICSRKSSRLNWPDSIRAASSSAFFSSTTFSKSCMSPTTSPNPRIRDARPSGRKASSWSRPSPIPTNLIGLPVTARTDSAAPPRASPSSFVRTTPSSSRRRLNSFAVLTASWPIMASTTSRMFATLVRATMSSSSAMRNSSMARRPAVSKITTSRSCSRACAMARSQSSGGWTSGIVKTGISSRLPRIWSCWIAAGRYTSAATSSGRFPSCFRFEASFAAVVVLPEPWSPAMRMVVNSPGPGLKVWSPSPMRSTSSSWQILTKCSAGPAAMS